MHDELISRLFWDFDKNISSSNYRRFNQKANKYKRINEYLNTRFNDSSSRIESLLRIVFKIYEIPVCPVCGSKVNFIGKPNSKGLYGKYCSMKCRAKDNHNSYNNVNKAKHTKLERYGNENYNNPQKRYLTKLKKYGDGYYVNRQQGLQTYIENHPKITIIDERTPIEKSKDTRREKYGDENYNNISKYKETCKTKYGVEHWSKSKTGKLSLSNILSSNEIRDKVYITKQKNNSFNKSKPEDNSYALIKNKYNDVIRQYKSKEYPFNCDFYIPSINTYIECNYFWTHGFRPYTGTNEDIIQVKEWKEHNTEFYDNAIETWTIRDVRKRNIAKENGLNWFEFFNINDLKEWIKSE